MVRHESVRHKVANRSFVIDPAGGVRNRYDKVHLFDVSLRGLTQSAENELYTESDYVHPGREQVVAELPFARIGLSICYDLRFPQLYRSLAQSGSKILLVPSAFTKTTGAAHWHTLLRARAIETGCYVVAAAQCGERPWGRATFGHSLIVDPWGTVLADAGAEETVIVETLDLSMVEQVRERIPSLFNDPL